MIMLSIILGSTLYSTTLLIASTLLPQMQVRWPRLRTRSPGR
jgi:hypothetical protein